MEKKLLSKEAINDLEYRIVQEEFSSRLYENMSLWLNDLGYINISKLYKRYSEEELIHAGWAKEFLLSYDLKPTLKAIPSPEMDFDSCMDLFEKTLSHEIDVTKQCEKFAVDSLKRGEITLYTLALKYCSEQIEELRKSYDLINIHKLSTCPLVLDQYIGNNLL